LRAVQRLHLSMTQQQAPVIDYAPAPPWHRRRWGRIAALVVLLAAGVAAWRFGPSVLRQAKTLYWQRQCANFSLPPDQVVYEEDPATTAALMARGGEYGPYRAFVVTNSPPPRPTAAVFIPKCWAAYQGLIPGPMRWGNSGGAVLFLHELVAKNGVHRIVAIEHAPSWEPQVFVCGYDIDPTMISPATGLTTPATLLPQMYAIDVLIGLNQPPQKLRIYAGQIDPADPSHFTIRYEQWGQTDVVDGRLDPTGRWVEMSCRNHPEARLAKQESSMK
jgi:hypothetical protein